jgi:hypothetical protein
VQDLRWTQKDQKTCWKRCACTNFLNLSLESNMFPLFEN